MKLPKAKKLPSGSWNVQVMVDGKRVSVTASSEKEAIAKAAEIKAGLKEKTISTSMTVGAAIDRYIESKDTVLSPSTINGYKKLRKSVLQDIMELNVASLTSERVQRAVNRMARDKSPKYVRNDYGLFTAAMAEYFPDTQPT